MTRHFAKAVNAGFKLCDEFVAGPENVIVHPWKLHPLESTGTFCFCAVVTLKLLVELILLVEVIVLSLSIEAPALMEE